MNPINYDCPTHGVWNAARESGCPNCVIEMRHALKTDRAKLALFDEMMEALELLSARIEKFGDWDDRCFYYNKISAPELEAPLDKARAVLAKVKEIS